MKQKILILILVLALIASCVFALSIWGLVRKNLSAGPTVPDAQTEPPLATTEAVPTQCIHDWQDATCDMPNICTLCGETDGSPLDHSWTEATCEKAQTCTRCGLQTDAFLEHSWQGGSCKEPAACTLCGTLGDVLSGHSWTDATCIAPKTCAVCNITEGDTLYYGAAESHSFSPWEAIENDIFRTCAVCGIQEKAGILTSKEYNHAADILSRTWEANGRTLNLSRDGTFTGDLNGAVSGTWQLMMVRNPYCFDDEELTGCLNLRYTQEGTIKESSLRVRCIADGGWENGQSHTTLYLTNENLDFHCSESDTDKSAQTSSEEAAERLLGSWNSLARIQNYVNTASWQEMTVAHTIAFRADGTFSAHLVEDFSGTWQFSKDEYGTLEFDCTAEDGKKVQRLWLDPDGTLTIFYYSDSEQNVAYTFQKLDARTINIKKAKMAVAETLPLGSWVSHTIVCEADPDRSGFVYSEDCSDYAVTFHEDGTFTGTIPGFGSPQAVEDIWHLAAITPVGDYHLYHFSLQNADEMKPQLYLDNTGLYLQYVSNGGRYTVKFWRT